MKPASSSPQPTAPAGADPLPPREQAQLAALFNAGRNSELQTQALRATGQWPGSALAHMLLGTARIRQGQDGLAALQRAAALAPDDARVLHHLGQAFHAAGQWTQALQSYAQALAAEPAQADVWVSQGNTLKALDDLDEAAASYLLALHHQPDHADALNNLGAVRLAQGRLDEAVDSLRCAVRARPSLAQAHSNLGNALRAQGHLDEAAASYRRAMKLRPDFAEAPYNLGVTLRAQGRLDEAAASYRLALRQQPDHADALNNLGLVLNELGQLDEALHTFRRLLQIRPGDADAHNNLGNTLTDLGRLDEAVQSYRRAVAAAPDAAMARSNLLFACNYLPGRSASELLAQAREYGEWAARRLAAHTAWANTPDPGRRLRVGWVSGDLGQHPVGYFAEGVLSALAADAGDRLETWAYASFDRADPLARRLQALCSRYQAVAGWSDARLAQQVRDDGIDILIDLAGHTANNRLPMFAAHPAPVQVSWLGYFATTGVTAIDHLLADPLTLPTASEAHFTEHVWRLPETRLCFTPPDLAVDVGELPALTHGGLTFGCFNNLSKMNDEVVALWARVLQAVAGSRLFLKCRQLDDATVRRDVLARFGARGIAPGRLMLEGKSPRAEYLAAYRRVDIALDPFPFTGGATSAEGLWMGVPVLTLAGDRLVSRQGLGLLTQAGLPDWVATDADSYVACAVAHAADLPRLAQLRQRLRAQVLASPLFDAGRFAAHLEAALRGMWVHWCEAQQRRGLKGVAHQMQSVWRGVWKSLSPGSVPHARDGRPLRRS